MFEGGTEAEPVRSNVKRFSNNYATVAAIPRFPLAARRGAWPQYTYTPLATSLQEAYQLISFTNLQLSISPTCEEATANVCGESCCRRSNKMEFGWF